MKQIAKNINYKVNTEYGAIDITINLSKPEKDPKQIAKRKSIGKYKLSKMFTLYRE